MTALARWDHGTFTHDGITHETWRQGSGPGVVVIHEIPGMTPEVIAFGQELVDHGFTVVMPLLFGEPGRPMTAGYTVKSLVRGCVSKEFAALALRRTAPVTRWLAALASDLHGSVGGPGVGAVGMCFTGGFALAMMVDDAVVAPVLAQPSAPFPITPARSRDLGLSPADRDTVVARANAGCPVLGLRFENDPAVGRRFEVLHEELGENFTAVEFPGRRHSTLTLHRQERGVRAVLDFLDGRLR
ncbi:MULTISPECIES: dienelactone hydrolase family protein [Aeromicrobium]|uniref:dienelactone hydrolase family protein n=1 Tax=Aeromicrobium TaxID=2040 RepID=UPI00257AD827|nr:MULTISPECIES: dienelactone hydrolase family protein [Aeromicrobium]